VGGRERGREREREGERERERERGRERERERDILWIIPPVLMKVVRIKKADVHQRMESGKKERASGKLLLYSRVAFVER